MKTLNPIAQALQDRCEELNARLLAAELKVNSFGDTWGKVAWSRENFPFPDRPGAVSTVYFEEDGSAVFTQGIYDLTEDEAYDLVGT